MIRLELEVILFASIQALSAFWRTMVVCTHRSLSGAVQSQPFLGLRCDFWLIFTNSYFYARRGARDAGAQ